MSEVSTEVSRRGLGLGMVLTVVFVVLKLTGNIDWSWIWVFSPIWISWALFVGLVFVVMVGVFIFALFTKGSVNFYARKK